MTRKEADGKNSVKVRRYDEHLLHGADEAQACIPTRFLSRYLQTRHLRFIASMALWFGSSRQLHTDPALLRRSFLRQKK